MSANDPWYVGKYFSNLLVVPESRLVACRRQLQILHDVLAATSWDEAMATWDIDDIESAIPGLLDAAWAMQEESEEDRPSGALPLLGFVQDDDLEALSYAADCLDDSHLLMQGLPQEVMDVAYYPATSPMTEYEPCYWQPEALPTIRSAAQRLGVEIREDQGVFAEIERLFVSR